MNALLFPASLTVLSLMLMLRSNIKRALALILGVLTIVQLLFKQPIFLFFSFFLLLAWIDTRDKKTISRIGFILFIALLLFSSSVLTKGKLSLAMKLTSLLLLLGVFPFHPWLVKLNESLSLELGALPIFIALVTIPPLLELELGRASILLCALGLISICFCSLLALFERDIMRFLAYQNAIHMGFICVDLGALPKSPLALVHLFNFAIAANLFFICIALQGEGKFEELKRSEFDFPLFVSILSLGELPGLNVFVSEWLLISSIFSQNPLLVFCLIAASLLCLVAYLKALAKIGGGRREMKRKALLCYAILLSIACFIFSVPRINLMMFK